MDAIANKAVEIPGTEGLNNAIPVIVSMWNTRDVQVTVVQESGKWWIVSSLSQKYTLVFWEIKSFIG